MRKLRRGAMPPEGVRRPDKATYDGLTAWLEGELDRAAASHPNPGRPLPHRLNRAEYANAIRDLLRSTSATSRRCCRPTTRRTASTTSPRRSARRRCCSSATSRRRDASARWRSAIPTSRRVGNLRAPPGLLAGSARRRAAVRHRGRHAREPHLSARRRVRAVGDADAHQRRRDARPRGSAPARVHPRRRAGVPHRRSAARSTGIPGGGESSRASRSCRGRTRSTRSCRCA